MIAAARSLPLWAVLLVAWLCAVGWRVQQRREMIRERRRDREARRMRQERRRGVERY